MPERRKLLHKLITEPLAETALTIAVMYGSYVFAETLGISGLIAVPIAGLYMGNRTIRTKGWMRSIRPPYSSS